VALRKPSDFFEDKNKNGVSESIKDTESFDTFQSYKKNLEKFDAISKFSGSLEDYNENVERVNYLSQQLLGVQEEIKTLLTQEDLDRAMMSQLLVVEETTKDIQSRVKTINNEKLADVREKVEGLTEQVNQFISIDVPKYKSLVIDSENRAYSRYDKFEGRISESIETVQQSIDDVRSSVDEKHEEINENIFEFQDKLTNKVSSVKKTVGKFIEEEKVNISENQIKVRQELENFENKLKEISVDVFESSEDNKNFKSEIAERVDNFFESSNSTFDQNVKEIKDFKQELSEKVDSLEVDLIRNESHIKVQNESLDKIQVDVREAIEKLKINELEEKNASLARKVNYIQEVLDKFNEKQVLTESITEPPSTNNSDPLTPTDQNFVTFDQLQGHYRLFINRIQQQLSTLGGGGETRLEFLDDVDRDSAKVNGKFLKYDSSVGKWVGANASGGAGSQTLDETLGLGNTSSLGMSVGVATATKIHVDPVGSGFTYSEDLVVQGNARVTGILSIGTSSIVLDANNNELRGVQQIRLHSADADVKPVIIKQVTEKIVFVKTEERDGEEVETEEEVSVGIGTTVSINTSGIITASSFVGDVTGIATGATRVYVDESEDDNTDYNIVFTDKDPGPGNSHHTMQVDHTGLTFNPFTNTLKVAHLESTGSILEVNDQLSIRDTLRVRADNEQFLVESNDGTNRFVVDTDNGNTEVMGTLEVDGASTFNSNVNITGVCTFQGNVNLGDNDKLRFGDDIDLEIFSDGSTSYIQESNNSNALWIKSNSTEIRTNGNQPLVLLSSEDLVYVLFIMLRPSKCFSNHWELTSKDTLAFIGNIHVLLLCTISRSQIDIMNP
jgi:hypothetical protein